MKDSTDMKSSTSESSSVSKELKNFASRHSSAFVDWEILHRCEHETHDEIPLDDFLDMIARDSHWYAIFLNNIKIRLTK